MLTPRELAKSLWPEFGEVFLIDLILSLCVIMAVLAACVAAARTPLFKAKMTEVAGIAVVRRIDVVETLALTGELEQLRSTTETRGGYESFLSGAQMAAPTSKTSILDKDKRQEEAQRQREAKESQGGTTNYVTGFEIVGSALIISGKIDNHEFQHVERPAFPDDDTPFSYVWLCGSRKPPDGWIAMPAPPVARPLPAELQYSRCRAGRRA
jgi:hypothetical protein